MLSSDSDDSSSGQIVKRAKNPFIDDEAYADSTDSANEDSSDDLSESSFIDDSEVAQDWTAGKIELPEVRTNFAILTYEANE